MMKRNTVKRVLAGCLAVLMLFGNAADAAASNLSVPLNEVMENVSVTETVTNAENSEKVTEKGTEEIGIDKKETEENGTEGMDTETDETEETEGTETETDETEETEGTETEADETEETEGTETETDETEEIEATETEADETEETEGTETETDETEETEGTETEADETEGLEPNAVSLADGIESASLSETAVVLKTRGADENEEEVLKKFVTWKEAVAYINTLSNTSLTYVVEFTEDAKLEEALTLPTKAAGIIFRGVSEEGQIKLTYTGDLKLTINTTFENISLSAEKYNSSKKEYEPYQSVLNLAGKTLVFDGSDAEFASITGTNTAEMYVYGSDSGANQIHVQKSVKNLAMLHVENAKITAGSGLKQTEAAISGVADMTLINNAEVTAENGTIAVTRTLYMQDGMLESNSKIEVKDIVSASEHNHIVYGGNQSGNILTVKGSVTEKGVGEDFDLPYRKAAIDIKVKLLAENDGYEEGVLLLNAANAVSAWFVVESEFDGDGNRIGVAWQTYKEGTVIKCGTADAGDVMLYLETDAGNLPYGSFTSLQDALNEITRLADTQAEYVIELNADAGDGKKPLTTPAQAAHITITGGEDEKTLYFSNKLTLNSSLALHNIILAPASAATVALNERELCLGSGTSLAAGGRLASVTGSGTKKASVLKLEDTELYVASTVKGIGTLELKNAGLTAEADVIIGTLMKKEDDWGGLTVTAVVTRSKGAITKVVPKLTIEGTAEIAGNDVTVTLREAVNKAYQVIDFSETAAEGIRVNGIPFVKAANLQTEGFVLSAANFGEEAGIVMKQAGYLAYYEGTGCGAELSYTIYINDGVDGGETKETEIVTKFAGFADAVTEINNLKTKRAYTITLYAEAEIQTVAAPKALTMPNKNYITELTVESGEEDYVTLYHTGNITLTSPTTLKEVYFAKAKAGSNPAAVTLSTGGNALTIDGRVYFNTPLLLNGGGKGTLTVTEEGQLVTLTNGVTVPDERAEQYICGSITNFAEVNILEGQSVTLSEFGVVSGAKTTYTAATLNVTTLNNAGEVRVAGTHKPGTLKLVNANLDGGHLYSCGTLTVTNMNLSGETQVRAETDFKITGKIYSNTTDAVLYTRQKTGKNPASYLNISGTVALENPEDKIRIGIYPASGESLLRLDSSTQLLSAAKATADMFTAEGNNVGNVGAYSADNTTGYFLKKQGNNICVYYYEDVAVALCKDGDEVLAYFASIKEAADAVNAYKDKNAVYTLVLLKDVNTAEAPAGLVLPSVAKKIVITSAAEERYNIFYTGNLTLKANTEFVNVCLNPMKSKNTGTAGSFATGVYDLELRDIAIGTLSGMAFKDITGNAKQTTTLATDGLVITGNIANSKELIIEKPVTVNGNVKASAVTFLNGTEEKANALTVKGTFATDTLTMNGYADLSAGSTLTIKDIINNQTEGMGNAQYNTISYGINSKGAGNLTVKGTVSGTNTVTMRFDLSVSGKIKQDYLLTSDSKNVKYTLSDAKKLAVVEKAALSEMKFSLNGIALDKEENVKANKGVYVIQTAANTRTGANRVTLVYTENGKEVSTNCLDMAQAVAEINNRNSKTTEYKILAGAGGAAVSDTNLTDASAVSALTMPKVNMAAKVTIASATDSKTKISFNGNIAYTGNLTLENCEMKVGNISGVKTLTLDDMSLLTTGTVTITDVVIAGQTAWDALGAVTVTGMDVSGMDAGAYLSTRQKKSGVSVVPQFTLKGTVTGSGENDRIPWKVYVAGATAEKLTEVSDYENAGLLNAVKESAGRFVAYPYAKSTEEIITYKTAKNEVRCGKRQNMAVRIVQGYETDGVFYAEGETYAQSFDEAVTVINSIADTKASYRMELLKSGEVDVIKTTKSGTAYGALTLPTKAASITIAGTDEAEPAVICYTGTLKVNCNLTLENVALTEGTLKNGIFIQNHSITPVMSGAYELTFGEGVTTLTGEGSAGQQADICLTSVSAAKGTVRIENTDVYVTKALNVKKLELTEESNIRTVDKATVATLVITQNAETEGTEREPVVFYAEKNATVTDITGTGTLRIKHCFTKTAKASAQSVTQLAINGSISGTKVQLVPVMYSFTDKSYHELTKEEAEALYVATAKPAKIQNLATMPKASAEGVSVWYQGTDNRLYEVQNAHLYKQDSILYLTDRPLLVKVTAQNEAGEEVYNSTFLSWEQAVKEIDKRADSKLSYEMQLLDNVTPEAGVKTLTLPAKAKEVTVTSEEGETNYICFTGTSVSVKCNTNLKNIGFFAVKKVGNSYNAIVYNISAGNYKLAISDMMYCSVEGYVHKIGTLSGSAKGTLIVDAGSEDDNAQLEINKISGFGTVSVYNEDHNDVQNEYQAQSELTVTSGMSGIGLLKVYPGASVYCEKGVATVKNADIYGGTVKATNITISEKAILESAELMAGSSAKNDGKMQFKDIVVQDKNNYLSVKQDKNGKSQLTVNGTVTAGAYYNGKADESALTVDVYYNDHSGHARLSAEMVLLTAPKADVYWFVPYYTYYDAQEDRVVQGMGYRTTRFGLYRNKKEIRYGRNY